MSDKWIFITWGGLLLAFIIIGIVAAYIGCKGDSQCFTQAISQLSNAIR